MSGDPSTMHDKAVWSKTRPEDDGREQGTRPGAPAMAAMV